MASWDHDLSLDATDPLSYYARAKEMIEQGGLWKGYKTLWSGYKKVPYDSTQQMIFDLGQQLMQNDYDQAMYERYMEDISPRSQMARYVEAGLNPNLLYNQIGSGNPSSPMEQSAPHLTAGYNADKRARVQSVLSDINSVFQAVGSVVSSIGNVQQMKGQSFQNDLLSDQAFFSSQRRNAWSGGMRDFVLPASDFAKKYPDLAPMPLFYGSDGTAFVTRPDYAEYFPEMITAIREQPDIYSKFLKNLYSEGEHGSLSLKNQLMEKQLNDTNVSELVQKLVKGFSDGKSVSDMLPDIIQLVLLKSLMMF